MNRPVVNKIVLAVPVILLIGGTAVFFINQKLRAGYELIPVQRGPIVESVYGVGTVTARHIFQYKLGVHSTVRRLFVQLGDTVKSGEPLMDLQDTAMVRAPFAGVVTGLNVNLGETALAQAPLVVVTDLKDRYVSVALEQQGAIRVNTSQKAVLSFEMVRGQKFDGVIRSIFPGDGQFTVQIEVPNLPPEILPGMTADVGIQISKRDDTMLVPVSAITAGQILVERAGKREKIQVKVGIIDGEKAEILSDNLHVGDRVLVKAPGK